MNDTAYPALCVSPICKRITERHEPGPTDGRSMLCRSCTDRMRSDLEAIATNWAEVERNLSSPSVPPEDGENLPSSRTETGIEINEAASVARSAAVEIVWYMARSVVDERDANPPANATTPQLAQWLSLWWVGHFAANHHPQVAAGVATDLRNAARRMRTAAFPLGARKVETHLACPENAALPDRNTGETVRCAGEMVAWVWPGMDRSPNLVCEIDHTHLIEPEVWQRKHWKRRLAEGLDSRQATRLVRLITSA